MVLRATLNAAGAVLLMSLVPAIANEPKTYTCRFETGSVLSYEKGAFKPDKASARTVDIGEVDVDRQSAVLAGQGGGKTLRVVRAVNALHFLEVAGEGFLNVTTVYDRDDQKGAHPAVHSRHFGILGQPLVSQYTGFCEAK